MDMYERILVPTDGSKGAEVAVEHARAIGEKFDAEIHIIYVADVRVGSSHDMFSHIVGDLKELGEDSVEELEKKFKGLETETYVVEGIPHQEILDYTDENSVDLVVMGSHGRSGLDRLLIGSTAEKVVRNSEIPVMTVKRDE